MLLLWKWDFNCMLTRSFAKCSGPWSCSNFLIMCNSLWSNNNLLLLEDNVKKPRGVINSFSVIALIPPYRITIPNSDMSVSHSIRCRASRCPQTTYWKETESSHKGVAIRFGEWESMSLSHAIASSTPSAAPPFPARASSSRPANFDLTYIIYELRKKNYLLSVLKIRNEKYALLQKTTLKYHLQSCYRFSRSCYKNISVLVATYRMRKWRLSTSLYGMATYMCSAQIWNYLSAVFLTKIMTIPLVFGS